MMPTLLGGVVLSYIAIDNMLEGPLRIFLKDIDAFIIGFYLKLAQTKSLKISDIRGQYKIINNRLYLDDLKINSIKFGDKISLSSLNKNCII